MGTYSRYLSTENKLTTYSEHLNAINSLFGVCSNQYFLFFDNRIAEGITMTGQYIIRRVAESLNNKLSEISGENSDKVTAIDTDSNYLHFGPIVKKYLSTIKDDNKVTDAIIKISNSKIAPLLDSVTSDIASDMNFYQNRMFMKLEGIAPKSIFLAKKRYIQKIIDNEGVRYAKPEVKIVGLETQRSSTPDLVREWLTDAIKLILDDCGRDGLIRHIDMRREEFRSYKPEDVAFPRSANNLTKFTCSTKIYKGGTPIGVRAALLYNHLVKQHGLESTLDIIREGDKIKFLYLKMPNTIRENVIGFPSEFPTEFKLNKYVDYDLQFEKAFLDPLVKIMDALKWQLTEPNSLDDFFN